MFWALEQRRKWRAQLRAEAVAATEERYRKWLAKVAEEDNLNLERLIPPKEDSGR